VPPPSRKRKPRKPYGGAGGHQGRITVPKSKKKTVVHYEDNSSAPELKKVPYLPKSKYNRKTSKSRRPVIVARRRRPSKAK
jgi:hypothetical protein